MSLNSKNFDLCCRTCLRDDSEELYEIFGKDAAGSVNIAELITSYTSIQVRYSIFLYNLHCNSTFNIVVMWYFFY